ncbi:hypothetical protein ACI48D_13460 [Massilia sp. LXY-6]|uniref:hypothetical protein n=1 Tax=Massilia sp. LXY-6 TaxID=3379823 RepID=UPI003EDEFDBC
MTRKHLASSLLISTLLAGCGGGGGGGADAPVRSSAATYTFVRPKPGAHLVFAQKLTDNLNNTINRTMVQDVTSVNADGSFTVHEEDPSHDRTVSGSVDQSLYPTDYQYNASGQPTSWVVAPSTGATVRCTLSQGNPGAPSPLTLGQAWTVNYVETCGTGAGTAFTQSGTLAGAETITVAAGTFSAFKFTSTVTRTVNGTTRTETVTLWRDASGADSRALKSASVFTYSGATPPAGALVSETSELQSYQ